MFVFQWEWIIPEWEMGELGERAPPTGILGESSLKPSLNSHLTQGVDDDQSWPRPSPPLTCNNPLVKFLCFPGRSNPSSSACHLDFSHLSQTTHPYFNHSRTPFQNPLCSNHTLQFWAISSCPKCSLHWKDWCWSWNSNTLATWCKELTHWKRPCCWESLKAEGEGDDREWDGWIASPTQWTWV